MLIACAPWLYVGVRGGQRHGREGGYTHVAILYMLAVLRYRLLIAGLCQLLDELLLWDPVSNRVYTRGHTYSRWLWKACIWPPSTYVVQHLINK